MQKVSSKSKRRFFCNKENTVGTNYYGKYFFNTCEFWISDAWSYFLYLFIYLCIFLIFQIVSTVIITTLLTFITTLILSVEKNYCKEHKFSPMFTGLFILFIKATTTTSPLVTPPPSLLPTLPSTTGSTPGIARNFTHRYPIVSRPVALRTTNAESEKIANLEVKYRTSRTNFTHRIA